MDVEKTPAVGVDVQEETIPLSGLSYCYSAAAVTTTAVLSSAAMAVAIAAAAAATTAAFG